MPAVEVAAEPRALIPFSSNPSLSTTAASDASPLSIHLDSFSCQFVLAGVLEQHRFAAGVTVEVRGDVVYATLDDKPCVAEARVSPNLLRTDL